MARRRRRTRRRRAASGVFVRRRGRSRRIKVRRVSARAHGLRKRRYYRANPIRRRRSRRNPFKMGGGLMSSIPPIKVLGFAAAGAIVAPILIKKLKIDKYLPAGNTGLLVQAVGGAILVGFLGKLLGKRELGKQMALGAAIVPAVNFLKASLPTNLVAGDFDFGNGGFAGAEYAMPEVGGGEYSLPLLSGDDEDPDFGNL